MAFFLVQFILFIFWLFFYYKKLNFFAGSNNITLLFLFDIILYKYNKLYLIVEFFIFIFYIILYYKY